MVQKKLKSKLNKYIIFTRFFFKKGKIQKIKKAINTTFVKLSKETNLPLNNVLIKILYSFYTYIEVKNVKIKRRLNIIPFSVRTNRRYFLVLKKIRNILKKKNLSLSNTLFSEFLSILKRPNKFKDLKKFNISQAYAHRSNTHFRWYF